MGLPCSRPLPALGLVFALSSCQALTDVDVQYVDCVPADSPYIETFDGSYQGLLDRCWHSENVQSSTIKVHDGDLVIQPNDRATWSENGAPVLSLRADGDFLMAVRVEAVTGVGVCLHALDSAGLVVKNSEGAWAAVMVRPSYPPMPDPEQDCSDAATPPASASVESQGFAGTVEPNAIEFGEDSEGDVAICRRGNFLFYYYREIETNVWNPLVQSQEADPGPLDVGLTTTAGVGAMTGIEGHFTSVAFWHGLESDACQGPLEGFQLPEEL